MKNIAILIFGLAILMTSCIQNEQEQNLPDTEISSNSTPILDLAQANRLASLPIGCIDQEYPNKLNQTIGSESDLKPPNELHPAFYGCFDWHSSVHGHWSLVRLLKQFPDLDNADSIKIMLSKRISSDFRKCRIVHTRCREILRRWSR